MPFTFRTRLYIGFTLAILLSAISGLISYSIFQKQATERTEVKHTRAVLDTAKNIQTLLIDMETGRRGFRATNEKRFLEPYNKALPHIAAEIASLKTLLADNDEEENKAILIEQRIDSLMNFWKNNGDDASAYTREIITRITDREKRQMDQVRADIADLQKDENKLLVKRREEYEAIIHDTTLSSGIDSILCEAIIIILVFFIFREFKKRSQVQEQLKGTVDQLKIQADELHASEEGLKTALYDVEHVNKQLEKFVYTVAHDIKSPLAGVSGSLSILKEEEAIKANEELATFVNLSAERVVHLHEMVNSILEYSRISLKHQQTEMVDTGKLIGDITELMFPPAHIRVVTADGMPVFKTKKIKIMEVFQNLISNAIKYNDKKSGLIETGCRDKGEYYEFYVRDNGRGIPEADQHRIFSLFRTKNASLRESSTGFGLNIVKLIIDEQGGNIHVESVPGEGSTFYFDWKK